MNQPNEPKNPDPTNAAWEDAMTRDFDARVRDLHEAPLDIGSVKGKAHQIKRNRRAAVAGGILGVAAIITPIALLANGDGDPRTEKPPFVEQSDTNTAEPTPAQPDYVLNGTWYQADGDKVDLPASEQPYQSAVLWDGNLVATYWDGEVYSTSVVIAEDGTILDTLDTTGPVVVNDAGTIAAWVQTDGKVIVSDGDEVVIGTVDLAAPGETIAWAAAAVSGGPNCLDDGDGCTVFLNSGLEDESLAYSLGGSDVVAPGVTKVFDATDDGVVSVINEVTDDLNTCGGLLDQIDGTLRWTTCDYQVQLISPDGRYVAAPPSQYDGLGPLSISVLDAQTQEETGIYSPEGGFIGTWAWSTDGNLLFDTYDGANWHLVSMATDGEITEIGKPIKGDEFDSPFTLIQH